MIRTTFLVVFCVLCSCGEVLAQAVMPAAIKDGSSVRQAIRAGVPALLNGSDEGPAAKFEMVKGLVPNVQRSTFNVQLHSGHSRKKGCVTQSKTRKLNHDK